LTQIDLWNTPKLNPTPKLNYPTPCFLILFKYLPSYDRTRPPLIKLFILRWESCHAFCLAFSIDRWISTINQDTFLIFFISKLFFRIEKNKLILYLKNLTLDVWLSQRVHKFHGAPSLVLLNSSPSFIIFKSYLWCLFVARHIYLRHVTLLYHPPQTSKGHVSLHLMYQLLLSSFTLQNKYTLLYFFAIRVHSIKYVFNKWPTKLV